MEIIKPASCFSKTSSLADIAFRSVSGIRFAESSASPSDLLAPAILMDGLIVSLSINESLDRSSFTKRSQRPSEAVSSITSHLWARALSPRTVSITVLPAPLAPVISIIRPGAPTPLSSPLSKSRMTLSRPISNGGSPPAVGLKGFILRFITRSIRPLFLFAQSVTPLKSKISKSARDHQARMDTRLLLPKSRHGNEMRTDRRKRLAESHEIS